MKRWNRRAQQRHRSKRPHKRFHAPDDRVVTVQPFPLPLETSFPVARETEINDAARLHWQGDGWHRMAAGARVEN